MRDVKHAIRMFRKSPGFTATAVAALALGIGATTAIFSIVNTVLLKPLPVFEPDRLVMLATKGENGSSTWASPAKFQHWRAQADVLQKVSAFLAGVMNYTGGDIVEQVQSVQVSADIFRCLGIGMLQGRGFATEEDLPNGPRVVVISQNLWTRRFASDPHILGKSISLSGASYTVIGIAADSLVLHEIGPAPEVYVSFQFDPQSADQGHYFFAMARLTPSITLTQANARLQSSTGQFRIRFPLFGPKESFSVQTFRDAMVGDTGQSLLILLSSVTLVLLIACANVASLLLVRATTRRREIAIRTAVGASRGRMFRQLLSESVLLSLAGGGLGLVVGQIGIRALLAVNSADLPLVGENGSGVTMDWRVAAFALATSLLTGILFGLVPAFQGSRADLNSILKNSSGRTGTGLRQNKARAVLVVGEVSLAVVLLIGSALLIRTFAALYAVDRGFEAHNVLTMRTSLTGPKYVQSANAAATLRIGLDRIRTLPGVVTASATCCVPLQGGYGLPFNVIGRPLNNEPSTGSGGWTTVSPGFFEVFKIPVKRGRAFTERDDHAAPAVVVINERMAKQYWKDGDPLNDRIAIGKGVMKELADEPVRQIIGIVGDIRSDKLDSLPEAAMYVPQAQIPDALNALNLRLGPMAWVIKTQAQPLAMVPAIRDTVRQSIGLPVSDVHSMDEVVSLSTARQRLNMLLMTVFGSAALLLAAIGIYGLMSYSVEQRTQEIGIRMALGADSNAVRNMVVFQGMSLVIAGIVIGVGGALVLSRFMESFVFGVKTRDPLIFVAVPALLSAVALLAIWLPANRASRVSPVESLRYE